MNVITIKNNKSTPHPIVVATLLLGISSPIVSFLFWKGALYHMSETNDMVQVSLMLFFAIIWPLAWIAAMFLGALNPLLGKTIVEINKDSIEVRKILFSIQWKYVKYDNDKNTILSIVRNTVQSPTQSSANQIGRGSTTRIFYCLMIRDGAKKCLVQESYEEDEVNKTFNIIRDARTIERGGK